MVTRMLALCLLLALPVPVPSRLQVAAPAPREALFTFRSGFWVNLHHFLYVLGHIGVRISVRQGRATKQSRQYWRACPDLDG